MFYYFASVAGMVRNSNRFSSCQKYVHLHGDSACVCVAGCLYAASVCVWKMTLSETDSSAWRIFVVENNFNHAMMRHLSASASKTIKITHTRETITFYFYVATRYARQLRADIGEHI